MKSRKELRESRDRLENSQRNLRRSEVELFAAGIAHEFNNVLGAALGHAEFALDSGENADMREALQLVVKACERAREITWALKGLAQPREERIGTVKLSELLKDIATWAKPMLALDDIEFKSSKTSDLSFVGDFDQLKEILMNLIKNARDSLVQHGTKKGAKAAGAKIEFSVDEQKDHVNLCVSDNGVGVAPEFREMIFQPFFTTKGVLSHVTQLGTSPTTSAPSSGMGLGLYMAQNAAREHGGDLTLGPKGSEFILKLPL